jgi:hypothetical protein
MERLAMFGLISRRFFEALFAGMPFMALKQVKMIRLLWL